MKARFACEPNPSAERLRTETEAAFRRVDSERVLERRSVGTTETKIAHDFGGVPRWREFNKEAAATVYQTQPPDRNFLYLAASAPVVVSLELF